MRRGKKNQLAAALALALVLGTYGGAEGAGLGKVSDLTAQNGATSGNTIYYGAYKQDASGSDYKKGTDGRYQGVAYKVLDNTNTSKVVVMSDKIMDASAFRADSSQPDASQWSKSDVYKKLNDATSGATSYINDAFSSKELGLVVDSTVETNKYNSTTVSETTTQKVYLLSVEEIAKYFGVTSADFNKIHPELQAQITDYAVAQGGVKDQDGAGHWWLRSPGRSSQTAMRVYCDGGEIFNGLTSFTNHGVRPVLQLNLDNVLFTSVASDGQGKSAATAGSGFITPTDITTTSALKLTMKDEYDAANNAEGQQEISVNTVSDTANLGMKYSLANAYTGDKADRQVIAGLIGDTNYENWTNYAKLADVASGATEVTGSGNIAATGLADGTYGLSLYSEQANDWDKTDYAGKLKNIFNITVKDGAVNELILKSTDAADPLTVESSAGIVTLEEDAYNQDLTAQNSGTYKIRDGKDITLNGTLTMDDGTIDMTKNIGKELGSYNTLTVNNMTGTGNLLLDTDLAKETSDKVVINNAAAGTGGTIQVYDASLVTGNKVSGSYKTMLVQDNTASTTWTGKDLDTGGLWEITPTVEKLADNNWYLTSATAAPNPPTNDLIGTMNSGYGLWRSTILDDTLRKRLGDLRYEGAEESGLWARVKAGKLAGEKYDSSYQMYQVGMDKKAGNSIYGFAVDYTTNDNTLGSGVGEGSNTGLSLYATSYHDNGAYSDVVLRAGKLSQDMRSNGEVKDYMDYSTWGYSASYEVGKTFRKDDGWFIEPQAQLIYGRLQGGNYTTDKGVNVSKDGSNSFIGRLGFVLGRQVNKNADYYFKANVYKEFSGSDSMNMASGIERMQYENDHKDTWFEAGIGTNIKMNNNTYFYGDVLKTFGADIQKKWQINAGLRWTWGGAKKAAPVETVESVETPAPVAAAPMADYYMDSVHFDTDQDTIRPDQAGKVTHFAEVAKENPGHTFKLVGNTDSDASDSYNEDLSRRRVERVKNAAEQKGVPAAQIQTNYKGEKDPASSNATAQGKADNRRVDMWEHK